VGSKKRTIAFLVSAFSVIIGASYSFTAMAMPATDMTVSQDAANIDAVDDVAQLNQETTMNINVLANDKWSGAAIKAYSQGQNGEVKSSAEGGLRYTPNSGFSGVDMFTYTISNGDASDTATVTVTVDPVPNPCQSNLNGLTGTASIDKVHRTVTYKVVLPHPTCSAATLSGDTYVLPRSYDNSGQFNESATPARYSDNARSDITIPRGYRIASTTKPIGTSKGWVMGVVYNGMHQDEVMMPGVMNTLGSDIEYLPRLHWRPHHHYHHR